MKQSWSPTLACAGLLAFAPSSCKSPEQYSAEADAETYALIESRRAELFEDPNRFWLGSTENSVRSLAMRGEIASLDNLGILDCLIIAADSNEDYLRQKESLYLSALSLTQERWNFGLRSDASADASVSGTGTSTASAQTGGGFSLSRLMGSGANIVLGIGSSLFRLVSTGDGWDVVSDLSLSVTQPLWRAAGARITLEPLTQAERNLVYQVRDYERFRRTFAVTVARQVYNVLQAIDELENEKRNLENLQALRTRNERLAEAGQLSDIESDQARQDELRSTNRVVELTGDLDRQIDGFKLFLGLPIDLEISLDRGEFDRLTADTPLLDWLTDEAAVELALLQRLEVQSSADGLEDAERTLAIAADALRPGLGLAISANASSMEGRPLNYTQSDVGWSLGLDLDPAWDDLPERNTFRRAEIAYGSNLRSHERFVDRIQLDVREALRNAINTKERYEIQQGALELAKRRVRSSELSQKAGRASTRDYLESQESLIDALNATTSVLIDLRLALLELQLALEALRVDETGIYMDPALLEGVPTPPQESDE